MAGSDWIECPLSEACASIDYGYTASAATQPIGPRFLRITDIVSGHVAWDTVPHVAVNQETLDQYRLADGDVVLARTGASTGASAYIQRPPEAVFASYLVRLKTKPTFDARFVAYYLKSNAFWSYIRGVLGDKSAQPNASASTMTKAPLRAPRDINQQRGIAHILGTLDDKIELNGRINETLEAIARAFFKSWFVDFLPVRAKMVAANQTPYVSTLPAAEKGNWFVYAMECEDGSVYIGQTEDLRQRWQQHCSGKGGRWTKGHPPVRVIHWEVQPSREKSVEREKWLKTGYGRKWLKQQIAATNARTQTGDPVRAKAEGRDPGLPKPLAEIFPDRFVESEIGEIPAGWRVGNVGEFATLSRDGINPEEFPDETFDHFSIPAFDEGRKPKSELGSTIKSNKFLVPPYAVLLSKLNPRIPRIWLPVVRDNPRAICSTEFLVALPRTGTSPEFLYSFLSSEAFAEVFEMLVTGTSGSHQRVKSEGLLAMDVVIPAEPVIHQFTKVTRPLLARVGRARDESETLATLRDTLLPKLISGELRVKDAKKLVEEAV